MANHNTLYMFSDILWQIFVFVLALNWCAWIVVISSIRFFCLYIRNCKSKKIVVTTLALVFISVSATANWKVGTTLALVFISISATANLKIIGTTLALVFISVSAAANWKIGTTLALVFIPDKIWRVTFLKKVFTIKKNGIVFQFSCKSWFTMCALRWDWV